LPSKPLKVLIAGGGTGGHFFSGVAVGESFLARNAGSTVVYVGTTNGIEARVGPEQGLDVRFLSVSGIKGKGLMGRVRGLLRLPLSGWQSLRLLMKERPDVVMGVGGYASGPLVATARLIGIKTGIVEQNSVAGLTNKLLGKLVHRVFVAFEAAAPEFPARKVHITGNPLREQVVELLALESTGTVGVGSKLKVLVVGGSQGARAINDAFISLAEDPPAELVESLVVTHQTGVADEERVAAAWEASPVAGQAHAFIHQMAEAYRAADLVVCRAGALTVSELAMSGRPAVFIPYPFAIYNHQETNARALVDAGAAEMILQDDLSAESLGAVLLKYETDRRALQNMAWKAGSLARPEAAAEVVDEMYRVLGIP
jgi:UDP-N-acetylglucosamine--N-acetylmuramyl-(pentapeptide) pyrophosphoryl-undecaprenol N-acetylglucosamine transferase